MAKVGHFFIPHKSKLQNLNIDKKESLKMRYSYCQYGFLKLN